MQPPSKEGASPRPDSSVIRVPVRCLTFCHYLERDISRITQENLVDIYGVSVTCQVHAEDTPETLQEVCPGAPRPFSVKGKQNSGHKPGRQGTLRF